MRAALSSTLKKVSAAAAARRPRVAFVSSASHHHRSHHQSNKSTKKRKDDYILGPDLPDIWATPGSISPPAESESGGGNRTLVLISEP